MAHTAESMMILTPEHRRKHFRNRYAVELGLIHATGACAWPIEQLPMIIERVMAGCAKRQAPIGKAWDNTLKAFSIKTQKAVWQFLEY
jgi:hypothetical protein